MNKFNLGDKVQEKEDGYIGNISAIKLAENDTVEYEVDFEDVNWIEESDLRAIWEPEHGETYYMPEICGPILYAASRWWGKDFDCHRLVNHLVFKTKEEAIEFSNRILETIKEV